MIPSKFTLEELRSFELLCKLPVEALDLLAFRLDKLDARYHHDPTVTHVEIGLDPHLHRVRSDTDPSYGRLVGPQPTAIEKEPEHHRWHDLARQIDGVLREISGLELGYASDGGPTGKFIAWAIKKITGETVEPGTVARTLRRLQGQT
jgi:hypothetical protein